MISPPNLPPPLRRGDKVGVAALSGPVDPELLATGLAALERLGYQPVEAANIRSTAGLFAGTDDERLDGFHRLAADPEVRAIVFARGGYGVQRILPRLDWRLLAETPRAYVGYSDLTPFLLQVVARLRLVAFHGPMVAADLARGLDDAERASFEGALAGHIEGEFPVRFLGPGEAAEGPLLGGCLALLTATLGTPYAPDLEGAILFFEDVGEPAYRIDRMLTHLRLSGSLHGLAGMVAGHLSGDLPEGLAAEPSGEDMLREFAAGYAWPAASGLCAGHGCPNLTLPLGAWARLDPERRTLAVRILRGSSS